MDSVSGHNFGPAIAYLIPGATLLVGLRPFSPTIEHWGATSACTPPTFSGFVYLSVAALALGMTTSAFRWVLVDRLHAITGLAPPQLNFARLQDNIDAISLLIEIHYRHYQFHANMFVAIAGWALLHHAYAGMRPTVVDLFVIAAEVVFFAASRDNLRRYYVRSKQVLESKRRH